MRKTDGLQGKSMPPHRVTEHHSDIITGNILMCTSAEAPVLEACNITMTQYFILVRLLTRNEPVKMSDLAQCLLLHQSTVTLALAQLEERGAVVRIPDEQDLRIVRAALRREGLDMIDRADLALAKVFKKFCDLLSKEQLDVLFARCFEVVNYYGLLRVSRGNTRYDTAFFETIFLLCSQIEYGVKKCGLTVGEYRVLYYLSTVHQGARMSDIARTLIMRLNEVTNVSKKLAAKELIQRTPDPLDRRATILEITSDGYALATEAAPVVAGYIRHLHKAEQEVVSTVGEAAYLFVSNFARQDPFVR